MLPVATCQSPSILGFAGLEPAAHESPTDSNVSEPAGLPKSHRTPRISVCRGVHHAEVSRILA